MQISDILRVKGTQVTTVQQTDPVEAVIRVLAEKRVGAVVVEDRWDKLVGIFSERDLVQSLAQRGTQILSLPVSDLMTTHVITCAATDRIDAILARMTLNRIRHMPVMQDTHLAGIVSIGDLVHHRLGEKELEAGVLLDLTRMRLAPAQEDRPGLFPGPAGAERPQTPMDEGSEGGRLNGSQPWHGVGAFPHPLDK